MRSETTLTAKQLSTLIDAGRSKFITSDTHSGATCASLVKRGFLKRQPFLTGPMIYSITDAGWSMLAKAGEV